MRNCLDDEVFNYSPQMLGQGMFRQTLEDRLEASSLDGLQQRVSTSLDHLYWENCNGKDKSSLDTLACTRKSHYIYLLASAMVE